MKPAVLRLKRGRDTRVRVHPWIFKGDVADVTDVEPGSVVTVVDGGGRFVGRGFYNSRPALCCRLLTWRDEPVGPALLRRLVAAAVARREVIDDVSVFSADEPGQAGLEGFEPERTWFGDHGADHVVVEEGRVRI